MMGKMTEWLEMDDGHEIYLRSWVNEGESPKAIVQISHGMAEHIARYDDFAQFLLNRGIFVYGNDHRGHGHTGEKAGVFGYFAQKDGFDRVVNDLHAVTNHIKKLYPDKPIILFGHSLGSFLSRRYIQKYSSDITGVILSGTGGNPGVAAAIGKLVAKREIRKFGKTAPSHVMNRIIFGSYNKGLDHVKNKFSWLSRDESVVHAYLQDPYCGFVCSGTFFYDLLTGLQLIHQDALIQQIRKDLPIFFISGDRDPVGTYAKGVKKAIKQLEKNGLHKIEYRFYQDARHEVLNEINKEEVYEDIIQWIERTLNTVEG